MYIESCIQNLNPSGVNHPSCFNELHLYSVVLIKSWHDSFWAQKCVHRVLKHKRMR